MYAPNPVASLIVLILLGGLVLPVALLPARPQSRTVLLAWIAVFGLISAALAYGQFGAPGPATYSAPLRSKIAMAALIYMPFAVSVILWRRRCRAGAAMGGGAAFLIVFVVAFGSGAALKYLNGSCVYFDYNHDEGRAWCPPAWQAGAG